MEESIFRKYKLLRKYTRDYRGTSTQAANPISALPQDQFLDVVKDLCDEIFRRHENKDSFLLARSDMPLKRNQARQKMSTLTEEKVKEFSFDLLNELEKRFPFLLEYLNDARLRAKDRPTRKTPPPDRPFSRDRASSFSRSDPSTLSRTAPSLSRNASLPRTGSLTRSSNGRTSSSSEDLQSVIDDLKRQLAEKKSIENEFNKLEQDFQDLDLQFKDEQERTDSLLRKKEAIIQDQENRIQSLMEEKESLLNRVSELERQNKVLKEKKKNGTVRLGPKKAMSRYSEAPTRISHVPSQAANRISHVPSLRPMSLFSHAPMTRAIRALSIASKPESIASLDTPQHDEFGEWIIEEIDYLAQQLEGNAVSGPPQMVLEPLREIISLTKMIAEECDKKEMDSNLTDADKDLLFETNYKISDELKQLVETSRAFVSSGSSRHLDKASKHLDELIGLAQDFFNVYNSMGLKPVGSDPIDFYKVIQEEVDEIALSIQDLVGALKEQTPDMDMITDLVTHLVKHVDFAIMESSNTTRLDDKTQDILDDLGRSRDALLDHFDEYYDRPYTVKPLVNAAYDIAKNSQDLIFAVNADRK